MRHIGILFVVILMILMTLQPTEAQQSFAPSAVIRQESGACDGFASGITVGLEAKVISADSVFIRLLPSENVPELEQLPLGATINILAGPICNDDLTWWFINYEDTQGWVIEGTISEYYIEPIISNNDGQSQYIEPELYDIIEISESKIVRRTPPLSLVGVSVSQGGGPCGFYDCEICYYAPDEATLNFLGVNETTGYYNENTYSNGDVIEVNPPPISSKYLVAICTQETIEDVYLISPEGAAYEPVITQISSDTIVTLPLEAYIRPGIWQFGMNEFALDVEIYSNAEPVHIISDISSAVVDDYVIVLSGFEPNERLIAWITDADAGEFLSESIYEELETEMDENGDFIGIFPFPYEGIIGESGNYLLPHRRNHHLQLGQYASYGELMQVMYQELWLNTSSTSATAVPTAAPVISTPVASSCSSLPSSRLRVGIRAIVTGTIPNNIRSQATVSSTKIGSIPSYGYFYVTGGPICADGFLFWQVNYQGITGWTVEGNASNYWMVPEGGLNASYSASSCVGYVTPRLQVGRYATILPGDRNALNSLPKRPSQNPDSLRLGSIPEGGVFTVLDGPVCGDGNIVWWLVDYNGSVGWTGEGQGNTYWAEPE